MEKLEQIQVKMKHLQAQADALISKKAQAAVDQIRDIMLKHGLTTADIEAKASAKRTAKGLKVSAAVEKTKGGGAAGKTKTTPKYQHPKTGATWTGHGRAPTWIAEAKDRNKFLIPDGAEANIATTAGAASTAKAAGKKTASKSVGATGGKGQRKGPQPALYRDPKSGGTWSGRGPAPAWLSGAKDRSKFLIDGASAAADAGPGSKPKATTTKVVATKATLTKKPAAKKTAARKAVSAKVPAKKAAAKNAVPAAVKKVRHESAAVPASVATVESSAELTT
jgi:DNA-binding protein H-NS